ncbi:MAG: hypothetical protein AAGB51_06185 [Planctomycetota bacterium]
MTTATQAPIQAPTRAPDLLTNPEGLPDVQRVILATVCSEMSDGLPESEAREVARNVEQAVYCFAIDELDCSAAAMRIGRDRKVVQRLARRYLRAVELMTARGLIPGAANSDAA